MLLDEEFKLERYKLVTDRQKYFTELARSSFGSYVKVLTGLAMASLTLISAQTQLGIKTNLLEKLIYSVAGLTSFWGFVAIAQISFCLFRWRGYRKAEQSVYVDSPEIKWWWWIFETLYCLFIAVSVGCIWYCSICMLNVIKENGMSMPT